MNPAALHRLLVDLEQVERFEATARVGCSLSGWISPGSAERAATDAQVQGLARLLRDETVGDAARSAFVARLLAEPTPGTGADRDPDWRRALAAQRRRRAVTGRPGEVLRWLQAHCVPGMDPVEVCRRCADHFAPPALRAAWAAEIAPRTKAANRVQPRATVARHVLGRELVVEAMAAWEAAGEKNRQAPLAS